jgi:hypothetical protein
MAGAETFGRRRLIESLRVYRHVAATDDHLIGVE